MFSGNFGRRMLTSLSTAIAILMLAAPAFDQTGRVQGKVVDEGVAAANSGNHQGAVDAFTNAANAMPSCADCYYNIGVSQGQLKNADASEAAFKKAIELRPAYPEAYNALAALYTAQRKMDLAAAAAAKAAELSSSAAGGGSADSLYSAGVGLWNANKFPEAQGAFEGAIKADANHA